MKKYLLLFTLFFLSFNLFSLDYRNSFSAGFAAYGNLEDDKLKLIDSYAPIFSYERLFLLGSDSLSLAAEANLLVAPYNNDYSLSVNAICYLGEFEGLFIGISPLSNINFGNLFLDSPYLNYAIGMNVGFRKNIKRVSLKSQLSFSVSFYDKQTPFKMLYTLCLGYLW